MDSRSRMKEEGKTVNNSKHKEAQRSRAGSYLPSKGAVFACDPMMKCVVQTEPLASTNAGLGPHAQASTGHRGLPQLQFTGNRNVVRNVDRCLVGRAFLGCGEVLVIAAAVAVVVEVVVVMGGVDVGEQQVVVVVVWMGRCR